MSQPNRAPTLNVRNTPLRVQPSSWLAGRGRPGRPWTVRVLVGAASTAILVSADLGHATAHILSARRASAPMDEILVASARSGHWRNNDGGGSDFGRAAASPVGGSGVVVGQCSRDRGGAGQDSLEEAKWAKKNVTNKT